MRKLFISLFIIGLNMNTMALAQSVPLKEYGLSHPSDIQFGVLTSAWQDGKLVRSSLARLAQEAPQKLDIVRDIGQQRPAGKQGRFVISSFEHGLPNHLGGRFGAFFRAPSQADVGIHKELNALHLKSTKAEGGFAGLWIQLKDARQPEKTLYLDSSDFQYLGFWVRGKGQFMIKWADQKWDLKDDALAMRSLNHFLPQKGLSEAWQWVQVPLKDLPVSLDRSRLSSFVLQSQEPGENEVLIRHLSLLTESASRPPLDAVIEKKALKPKVDSRVATWLWNTQKYIDDPRRLPQLVDFYKTHNIGTVYLQLPASVKSPEQGYISFSSQALNPIIDALHQAKIKVFALDGDKHYALSAWHKGVKHTMERIIVHNRTPGNIPFDGVQYDIEPYLLPAYFSKAYEPINRGFLALVNDLYLQAQSAKLTFGLAVPPWLDGQDEFTQKPFNLSFEGKTQRLVHHLQDMTDQLVIMDYRTRVWGAGGIVEQVYNELKYAEEHGKTVVVGLETMVLPDEISYLIQGKALNQRPPKERPALMVYKEGSEWKFQFLPSGESAETLRREVHYWGLKVRQTVLGSALSFATEGKDKLTHVVKHSQSAFSSFPAYGGMALHYTESLKTLYKSKGLD